MFEESGVDDIVVPYNLIDVCYVWVRGLIMSSAPGDLPVRELDQSILSADQLGLAQTSWTEASRFLPR